MKTDVRNEDDLRGAKKVPADTGHGVHAVRADQDRSTLLMGDAR
ncbi:MAG: hypothetical protein ABI903_03235 [Actinomycetota bacterium]